VSRAVPFVQADIFTTRPFGGTPAGAILDADGLSESDMRALAGELRLPGLAFVTRPTGSGAEFRLRYLTPAREVTYSGHTTLGAVHTLLEAGRIKLGPTRFETGAGTHCRVFIPHFGIPEDIVTGSVHSPMGRWLAEAGALRLDAGRAAFTAEQGDTVGRPGRLRVEVEGAGRAAGARGRIRGHRADRKPAPALTSIPGPAIPATRRDPRARA